MNRHATRLLAAVSTLFALFATLAAPAAAQVPIGIYNVADGGDWQHATVHLVTAKSDVFVGEVWISEKADALAWDLPAPVPVSALEGDLVLRPVGPGAPSSKAVITALDGATAVDTPTWAERVHLAIDAASGVVSGAVRLVPGACNETCSIERIDWFVIDGETLPAKVAAGAVTMPSAAIFPIEASDRRVSAAR